MELIESTRKELNKLIAEGLVIKNHEPRYIFTKLNDIKPQMLQEATKNARIAATEFANNAGVNVGGIRTARQGSFYIKDEGEDYSDDEK